MANTKKYVSLDKLSMYDEKIKKLIADSDAAALKSAQDYADGLAVNYDAVGSANTALESAKAYADGKDAAIAAAQKAGDDAAAAAGVADGKAVKAQGDVDALKTYVGTIPAGATATDVVGYVQEKTSGIATEGAMTELSGRVTTVEGKVATIEGDYLKAADKTELEGKITAANTAVETEKSRAEGVEAGLRTDVDAIKGDYLKAADKTALQGAIDLKAAQTALDAEVERATGVEEGLQNQINLIMNNPDTKDVIDSITEFTQYIADHGEIADGFRTDIDKNKEDIAAEVKRAGEAEGVLAGRLDVLEAIDHDAYKGADTALKNELNGEIAKKADASALTSAVEALEGADSAMAGRLDTLEAKFTGEGSVEDMIGDAKQEAIDAAAADATTKAGNAETAAKTYADGLNTAMNTRVEALEAVDHDHSNKAELDLIASGDKAKWDDAYAKRHEHSNKTVLDGITAENITTWNTVTSKAAQADLTAVGDRVTAIETWHANFVEVSEEEINALFTTNA